MLYNVHSWIQTVHQTIIRWSALHERMMPCTKKSISIKAMKHFNLETAFFIRCSRSTLDFEPFLATWAFKFQKSNNMTKNISDFETNGNNDKNLQTKKL